MMQSKAGGKLACEPLCGRGCTKAEHDAALKLAESTCRKLGKGWTPSLNHNLGWYASSISPCGRIKVAIHLFAGMKSFTAFLGPSGEPGGRWAEGGRTAKTAVRNVVKKATDDLKRLEAIIEGLPTVK